MSAERLALDGHDLSDIVRRPDPERIVYSQYERGAKAIYMAANERWKYVYSAGDGSEFLFDRKADPAENVNMSAAQETRGVLSTLKRTLLEYLRSAGLSEAFVAAENGALEWRPYPAANESYLDDPDAKLLFQDYPSYPMRLPGYSD